LHELHIKFQVNWSLGSEVIYSATLIQCSGL